MTPPRTPLPSRLPFRSRTLLQLGRALVPPTDRGEWTRAWQAELWHHRHRRHLRPTAPNHSLAAGLLRDALWLRGERLRLAHEGTAALCLGGLLALLALSALPLLVATGGPQPLGLSLRAAALRFLAESALILFVSSATSARHIQRSPAHPAVPLRSRPSHLSPGLFLAAKIALLLPACFLLSTDLCLPLQPSLPFTAALLQNFLFVLLALIGLRWSFGDHHGRCKHCLRALAIPARVGRPSRNFLDTNGTELLCKHGHGRLSIPEIETSWRRSPQWIPTP